MMMPVRKNPAAALQAPANFDPLVILEVLPKLMNSQVLLMMSGEHHRAEKALSGYMAFHHLFLALVRQFPKLARQIDGRLMNFIKDEKHRHKASFPNLGELLCFLSVSETYTWADICEQLIEEAFDRNTLWALAKYPNLIYADQEGRQHEGVEMSFDATIVPLKLLMFQARFLFRVKGSHLHNDVSCHRPSCRLETAHATFGLPTREVVESFTDECRRIHALDSYDSFFGCLGFAPLLSHDLAEWLLQSMRRAKGKTYYNPDAFQQKGAPKYYEKPRSYDPRYEAHEEYSSLIDKRITTQTEDSPVYQQRFTIASKSDLQKFIDRLDGKIEVHSYKIHNIALPPHWILLNPSMEALENCVKNFTPITVDVGSGCYVCWKRTHNDSHGICSVCLAHKEAAAGAA